MSDISLFANLFPLWIIYLFYGLAFLFLGISIVTKDMKESRLILAKSLWLLAGFGFSHGIHEWLELYILLQGKYLSVQEILWIKLITVFVAAFSFFLLLQFGITLIHFINDNYLKAVKIVATIFFLGWIIYLWNHGLIADTLFFKKADTLARVSFGIVGGIVTAYGLIAYSYNVKNLSLHVSKNFFYAGTTFIFYSIFTAMIPPHSVSFYLPVPVEVMRGISAVLITCFIVKALNIFDIETRRDLEHRLQRLAQSEKLASLGRLAAGVAHEINTPLTNASLNMQIMRSRLKNSISAHHLQRIEAVERNIDRASTIAKEILQFSRTRETEFIPLDINNAIEGALTLIRYKLRNIKVHLNMSDVYDVMGDPVKLEQVFINLLNNSIEAMPDERGDIFITTSNDSGCVKADISDTGIGISKEYISKAFDPFFTTKDIGAGTGLGLSICYGIINQHNGTIEITNNAGKGTTVTIGLPVMNDYEKDTHSR
ncbi:MAG: hypothetical protein HZC45_05605 [Deltaproteobacteria bacterium]|nr:hypothetical protein [Deltaproteobacteria bacterium]